MKIEKKYYKHGDANISPGETLAVDTKVISAKGNTIWQSKKEINGFMQKQITEKEYIETKNKRVSAGSGFAYFEPSEASMKKINELRKKIKSKRASFGKNNRIRDFMKIIKSLKKSDWEAIEKAKERFYENKNNENESENVESNKR